MELERSQAQGWRLLPQINSAPWELFGLFDEDPDADEFLACSTKTRVRMCDAWPPRHRSACGKRLATSTKTRVRTIFGLSDEDPRAHVASLLRLRLACGWYLAGENRHMDRPARARFSTTSTCTRMRKIPGNFIKDPRARQLASLAKTRVWEVLSLLGDNSRAGDAWPP